MIPKHALRFSVFSLALLLSLLCSPVAWSQSPRLLPQDPALFCGQWTGRLTYLDYTTGKPYTMPAQTKIQFLDNKKGLQVQMIYPNEPKANSTDTLLLDPTGKSWDGDKLIQRKTLANGDVEIIIEREGRDGNDNLPATIRRTITIGPKTYITRKDVRFTGSQTWIQRHEYRYAKD